MIGWRPGRLSLGALALAFAAPVDARAPTDNLTISITDGMALVDVDQLAEAKCEDRPSCTVRGYRSGRVVYRLAVRDDREKREVDCGLFDADDDHQCLAVVRAAAVPVRAAPPRRSTATRSRVTKPPARSEGGDGRYFASCRAARAAGAAPLRRGQSGYRAGLDRDDDGVACE